MKVLVIGGTQFNGLALVHELVRAGHDVTVLNRGRSEAAIPASVARLVADRTEPASMRAALAGTEWDCVQDMTAYHPPDVELVVDVLDGRVGHYVFASSTLIYAPSERLPVTEDHPVARGREAGQIEYGAHKLLCEDLLAAANAERGFPATTVAFAMVFGPHNSLRDREQKMFHRLRQHRPVLVPGDGTTLLQVGHVEDQARALEQLMGREVTFGRRYNLTGRDAVTRRGYVQTIAEVVGVEPKIVSIPPDVMDAFYRGEISVDTGVSGLAMDIRSSGAARTDAAALGARQRFQLAQLVQTLAPNLWWWNQPTVFSIDRLRADIGWEPQLDFPAMVAQTYEWFLSTGRHETDQPDWTMEDQLLVQLAS